jgi:hypothetical protein
VTEKEREAAARSSGPASGLGWAAARRGKVGNGPLHPLGPFQIKEISLNQGLK